MMTLVSEPVVGDGAMERDLLVEEARRAQALAEQALNLRDEFVSIAAHELKTPVASLKLCAQMLERRMSKGSAKPEDVTRGLRTIREQSDRLGRLIDGLLDISRLQAKRFMLDVCRTDVVSLAGSVCSLMTPLLGEHTVEFEAPESLWADVDPLRVEQIIVNLLTNAAKFTVGPRPIQLKIAEEGSTVAISVRDFGLGIPQEARDTLFNRFHQAHSAKHHGGMGLGLYISREIAEAHGGTLEAEHPPDGGAKFVLRLPLSSRPDEAAG